MYLTVKNWYRYQLYNIINQCFWTFISGNTNQMDVLNHIQEKEEYTAHSHRRSMCDCITKYIFISERIFTRTPIC